MGTRGNFYRRIKIQLHKIVNTTKCNFKSDKKVLLQAAHLPWHVTASAPQEPGQPVMGEGMVLITRNSIRPKMGEKQSKLKIEIDKAVPVFIFLQEVHQVHQDLPGKPCVMGGEVCGLAVAGEFSTQA